MKVKLATMSNKSDILCNLNWKTSVMDVSIRHSPGFLIEGSGQVCLLERCLVLLWQSFESVLMRVPFIKPSSGPWPKHLRTFCIKYMAYTVIEHYLNCGTYSNSYREYHPMYVKYGTNNGRRNTLTSWFNSIFFTYL